MTDRIKKVGPRKVLEAASVGTLALASGMMSGGTAAKEGRVSIKLPEIAVSRTQG